MKLNLQKNDYPIYIWKNQKGVYDDYWNDENVDGVFNNISKGNYLELEQYIEEQGFIADFENCLAQIAKTGRKLSGTGAEFAAGTMWLTSYILNKFHNQLTHFYSVDYSEKNIFKLGQQLLKHYNVNPNKLALCLGSFYDIKLPDESLDFIVMCQAFHHADDPDKLLQEAYRVLKKGGFLIMVGELFISKKLYFKCYLNYVASLILSSRYVYIPSFLLKCFATLNKLRSKKIDGSFQSLYFPPDPITGDHYYLKSQFDAFFLRNKFAFVKAKSKLPNHLAYVIFKAC